MKKTFCVVSHTHWDREWYQSYEKMRYRLVKLIDNLLDILNEYPNYIFHLDAQTIVLEDYIEIKPQNKELLKGYIKAGNILVGPWYVQNDFFLSSGESTIRNLLIGTEIAKEYGNCDNVGYCPDQFGIIGQLPQILKGFGINSVVFGRGLQPFKVENGTYIYDEIPSEFIWGGVDDSELLTINMKFWYNNAQRFSSDINRANKLVELNEKLFENVSSTPYLLLMNGVDHLEAQENLLPIINKLNENFDKNIIQDGLSGYIEKVDTYVKENNVTLKTFKGELREGIDEQMLQGTLSSRVYLKQKNRELENNIINIIEPIYTILYSKLGEKSYPQDYIKYIWKSLIPNQAHDSICGCSIDAVHTQMEDRFNRISEVQSNLISDAISIFNSAGRKYIKDNYIISVINTNNIIVNEAKELEIFFKADANVSDFKIFDLNNDEIDFVITNKLIRKKDLISPINLPATVDLTVYTIKLCLKNIEPLSVNYYKVVVADKCEQMLQNNNENNNFIENQKIKIIIDESGKINLFNKQKNQMIDSFITLEDTADRGDSYVFRYLKERDIPITNVNSVHSVYTNSDKLSQKLIVTYKLLLPDCLIDFSKRNDNLIENTIKLEITLDSNNDFIKCNYKINNNSKDHRLRVVFKTAIKSDFTYSNSAFEMVKRDIKNNNKNELRGNDHPNYGVISIGDGNEYCHIYNNGLHEYEHIDCFNGRIALTLLRANNYIYTIKDVGFINGDIWEVPENQCLRELCGEFVLELTNTDYIKNQSIEKQKMLFNSLLIGYDSSNEKEFTGGRAAVQDADLNEVFFRENKNSDLTILNSNSFFKLDNKKIVLSCFKKAENKNAIIIRLYNQSDIIEETKIQLSSKFNKICIVNLKEEYQSEVNNFNLVFKPGQIITLMLDLNLE